MLGHIKRIFSSLNIPVDFNDVELNSKDPTDEELEKAINAIHKTGAALKVKNLIFNLKILKYMEFLGSK